MRVIALLALFFGFMVQPMLDTNYMGHVVVGLLGGSVAMVCGFVSARLDPPNRGVGYVLAGLGAALAVWCAVMTPSAYRQQQRHNAAMRRAADQRVTREAAVVAEVRAAKERAIRDGLTSWMSDEEILNKLGYVAGTFTSVETNVIDGVSVTYSNETTSLLISRSYHGIEVARFRPADQQQTWMFGKQ